eukprot:764163-Hanusia_phi.AAC.6
MDMEEIIMGIGTIVEMEMIIIGCLQGKEQTWSSPSSCWLPLRCAPFIWHVRKLKVKPFISESALKCLRTPDNTVGRLEDWTVAKGHLISPHGEQNHGRPVHFYNQSSVIHRLPNGVSFLNIDAVTMDGIAEGSESSSSLTIVREFTADDRMLEKGGSVFLSDCGEVLQHENIPCDWREQINEILSILEDAQVCRDRQAYRHTYWQAGRKAGRKEVRQIKKWRYTETQTQTQTQTQTMADTDTDTEIEIRCS